MDLPQFSPGQLIGLLGVLVGPLVAITAIGCSAWARVRQVEARAQIAEVEAALKQQMIERGMSADDIERVLAANGSSRNSQEPRLREPAA